MRAAKVFVVAIVDRSAMDGDLPRAPFIVRTLGGPYQGLFECRLAGVLNLPIRSFRRCGPAPFGHSDHDAEFLATTMIHVEAIIDELLS